MVESVQPVVVLLSSLRETSSLGPHLLLCFVIYPTRPALERTK